jgi:hypothetical protein
MEATGFVHHGTPVMADEQRGAALVRAKDTELYYIICSRGYVLNVHLRSGTVRQALFPEKYGQGSAPFAALASSKGLFYTGSGKMFMEYDPVQNAFSYYSKVWPDELNVGFRLAESRDGRIYIASHPTCRLSAYDPRTRTLTDYGRMDEKEKYIAYIVEDAAGWVYMGIGTERRAMAAFNPLTGEKRQYLTDAERTRGCGYFHQGEDGYVYGHAQEDLHPCEGSFAWKRFWQGTAESLSEADVSPRAKRYAGYVYSWGVHSPGTDPGLIKKLDLNGHELVYRHPDSGQEISLRLDYFSYGAGLGRMVGGPDGVLYGCSSHPCHLYSFDPRTQKTTDYGSTHKRFICSYAIQGSIIGGACYTHGYIVRFDTRQPVTQAAGQENPRVIGNHDEIYRPRSAAVHPDGKRMVFGGFAGYGAVGGGLCVYNVESGEHFAIANDELVSDQSVVCMRFLPNGNLLCSTSIETPGGASPRASEAELFRFDLDRRAVLDRATPVPGAREVSVFEVDREGLIHGITSDSIYSVTAKSLYFVFDPRARKTIGTQELSELGIPVLGGMMMGEDGMIYGILTKAVYRINPRRRAVEVLGSPPANISAGMAIIERKLYFGAGSALWSYALPPAQENPPASR